MRAVTWGVSALLIAAITGHDSGVKAAGDVTTLKVVGVRPDEREIAVRCVREVWGGGEGDYTDVTVVRVDALTGRVLSVHPISRPGKKVAPGERGAAWAAVSKALKDDNFAVQADSKEDLVRFSAARRVSSPLPQTTWFAATPVGKSGAEGLLVIAFVPYLGGDPDSDDYWNVAVEVKTGGEAVDFFTVGRIEGDSCEVCPRGSADSRFSVGVSPFNGFIVIERALEGGEGRVERDYFLVRLNRSPESTWSGRLIALSCGPRRDF